MIRDVEEQKHLDVLTAGKRAIEVVNALHLFVGECIDHCIACITVFRWPLWAEDLAGLFKYLCSFGRANSPQARNNHSLTNRRIDWSDSWSDEDLRGFSEASPKRLDSEDPEDSR